MNIYKIKQATKKGFAECRIGGGVAELSFPTSKTRRGRVIEMGNISPTILTEGQICYMGDLYEIRKYMPVETWLLMGFSEEDFRKAETVNSNTQLYRQSGNSICKPVIMAIFKEML